MCCVCVGVRVYVCVCGFWDECEGAVLLLDFILPQERLSDVKGLDCTPPDDPLIYPPKPHTPQHAPPATPHTHNIPPCHTQGLRGGGGGACPVEWNAM